MSCAKRLGAFVRAGGVLLTDCRTAVKDENNLCHERTLPGLLAPVLGIEIQEYEAIPDGVEHAVAGRDDLPGAFSAVRYADWVRARGAAVLAGYADWHLKPYAAVTRNRFGKGAGWYVGTVVKEDAFYDALAGRLLADARIRPPVRPPEGVEVSVRRGKGRRLLFLINHAEEPRTVKVPRGRELITARSVRGDLVLDRYGVAVVRL